MPFDQGWLREEIRRASEEVAKWPKWKQEYYREAHAPFPPDPCVHPYRCDESQTCVGGCMYRNLNLIKDAK